MGRKSHVHPLVIAWSLDSLVKERVTQSESQEGVVTQLKEQIKEVDMRLDQVERHRYQMRATAVSGQVSVIAVWDCCVNVLTPENAQSI